MIHHTETKRSYILIPFSGPTFKHSVSCGKRIQMRCFGDRHMDSQFGDSGWLVGSDGSINCEGELNVRLVILWQKCTLYGFAGMGLGDHVRNAKFRNRLNGTATENNLPVRIQLSRLRWLDHVLCMTDIRLSSHALFFCSSLGVEESTWRPIKVTGAWIDEVYGRLGWFISRWLGSKSEQWWSCCLFVWNKYE